MSMSEEEIEKWTIESRNKELSMSTSCSNFEILDPHDPVISRLATQLFKKTNDYLQGEMALGQEHYTLLEDLNRLTITKYADLRNLVSNLNKSILEYYELYKEQIKPLLQQIDFIDAQVKNFEVNAFRLDSYTKKLEAHFKALEDN